jgi:hypothetical protein
MERIVDDLANARGTRSSGGLGVMRITHTQARAFQDAPVLLIDRHRAADPMGQQASHDKPCPDDRVRGREIADPACREDNTVQPRVRLTELSSRDGAVAGTAGVDRAAVDDERIERVREPFSDRLSAVRL